MRMLSGVLVTGLLLTGCSTNWPGVVSSAGGPDVAALRVTGTEEVDARGGLRLSPDGTRLLAMAGPCVTALDGSEERCVDRDEVHVDTARALWSPDGTKLVFTDDFWRQLDEPDVWVFDVVSGELRNLTDDGVDEFDLEGSNEGADLDVLASWSPDGETVRFARGADDSDSMELMSVPADGGEASTVRELRCGASDLSALAWSAEQVAWTCGQEGEVSLAGQSGGDPQTVLPAEGGQDRMLLSFSPDGRWLLVDSMAAYGSYSEPEGGLAKVVPTDGGEPVPVAEGKVAYPTWSPSGHAIAYVSPPGSLNVVAEPGGEPRELHSDDAIHGPDGMRLNWAPDRILALVKAQGMLFTLSG